MITFRERGITSETVDPNGTLPAAVVLRYIATGRHLRPMQALHWLFRRTFGRRYHVPLVPTGSLRANIAMRARASMIPTGLSETMFDFLGQQHCFPGQIDWHLTSRSRLWVYNLHYFDYALDNSRSPAWAMKAMLHWISKVPPRRSIGWEPYPASLRIVNWIIFALTRADPDMLSAAWRTSLYQQIDWLARNLEHEIQANHLLKNAKALIFGGAYFAGPAADRWLRKGLELMLKESQEQFLADGGHYERSAMYHAIALEDLLDVISLIQSTRQLVPSSIEMQLRQIAGAALAYLQDISFPDGATPMFNDSVSGIAKDTETLMQYGQSLGLVAAARKSDHMRIINKAETGYFGYRLDDEMLIIDAGPIGPPHQPGHGHCDMLSFELIAQGRPVIVNSGVYDYEDTECRLTLRQTAAHNTVRLNRLEQSDVWGCFRVGRRAKPGPVDQMAMRPDRSGPWRFRFAGSHQGYRHLPGRPMHHRSVECEVGRSWRVTDDILGNGHHYLESFIHFHPAFHLRPSGEDWIVVDDTGHASFRLSITGGRGDILNTSFCPAFGVRQNNTTMRVSASSALPHVFGYQLTAL